MSDVVKLPPEALQAWVDWDPEYEPREPLTVSQCGFVRSAFMSGFLAAQAIAPKARQE